MKISLNKMLRSFQKPVESISNYYILSTAFLGFICIFLAVISFHKFIIITFLMYPLIFLILCRSVVLLHDAFHNALYVKQWKNSLAGNLMSFLNLTAH